MTAVALRSKLYDYIRVADDKKLHALYNLLQSDIEGTTQWWADKKFIAELDKRDAALESGNDKGVTLGEMTFRLDKLRTKKY
jgi:3-phenylpropionate/cinnamic acid dioxygenase small subunit